MNPYLYIAGTDPQVVARYANQLATIGYTEAHDGLGLPEDERAPFDPLAKRADHMLSLTEQKRRAAIDSHAMQRSIVAWFLIDNAPGAVAVWSRVGYALGTVPYCFISGDMGRETALTTLAQVFRDHDAAWAAIKTTSKREFIVA